MKIIGTEKHRINNKMFSVHVVDILDSANNVIVKSGFFKNSESYKKYVFTNGRIEKTSVEKLDSRYKVSFKVHEGDWLVIADERGNLQLYINEQYCGPIKVKNKKIQEKIDQEYQHCRKRINAKRDFAKQMGTISREVNLPFQIVLAFKGNKNLLNQMVENIESAIKNGMYTNVEFMSALSGSDEAAMLKAIESLGIIKVPTYQAEKMAKYIYECLDSKKIIRRFE